MMHKVLSLLGLARRAGKLTFREAENLRAIRSGAAKLVILAGDAGGAMAKKYRDKSNFYGVPLLVAAEKKDLGRALGTSPCTAVVILDAGLALRIKKLLE
ncbi:MAG: 50S ribosomal protein L7ae [Firmicutes bacterium]|nr:50S ribosomal protein L7ae [Bacillota bacterium]